MAVVPLSRSSDVVIPRKVADEMIRATREACAALSDCHALQEEIRTTGWRESQLVALHLRRSDASKAELTLLKLVIDNIWRD